MPSQIKRYLSKFLKSVSLWIYVVVMSAVFIISFWYIFLYLPVRAFPECVDGYCHQPHQISQNIEIIQDLIKVIKGEMPLF